MEGPLTSGELSARTGLTTGATTRLIGARWWSSRCRDALAGVEAIVGPARGRIAEVIGRYSQVVRPVITVSYRRFGVFVAMPMSGRMCVGMVSGNSARTCATMSPSSGWKPGSPLPDQLRM